MTTQTSEQPRIGLFITCLVDVFRPNVAHSTIQLLEDAGCKVEVPLEQTCCGQPGYNSGHKEETLPIAKNTIKTFECFDYVVAPSGSCAAMLKHHYPKLFSEQDPWQTRALKLSDRCYELTSFLNDVLKVELPTTRIPELKESTITYHDSCSGLRELGIKAQPRSLLDQKSLSITEMQFTEVCCGFGGTFCAKFPKISERMVDDKLDNASATGAELILGGDLGCLLNIAGRASRKQMDIQVRHVAEVLAENLSTPPIATSESKNSSSSLTSLKHHDN